MFRRFSLKQQFFIATGFLFLGCIVMFVIIIYPSVRQMRIIGADIRGIQKELEQDYTETKVMQRTIRELDTVLEEIEKYKKMAIQAGDELALITEMEHLASINHLFQTLGVTYQQNIDPDIGLPYYNFSIVVNGSFENILAYLQTLEAQPYYIMINGIDISKADEGNVIFRFDARIYVRHT